MTERQQPYCVLCGQPLTVRELEQCRKQAERLDNQLLCSVHQRRFSGCPGLRHQPLG